MFSSCGCSLEYLVRAACVMKMFLWTSRSRFILMLSPQEASADFLQESQPAAGFSSEHGWSNFRLTAAIPAQLPGFLADLMDFWLFNQRLSPSCWDHFKGGMKPVNLGTTHVSALWNTKKLKADFTELIQNKSTFCCLFALQLMSPSLLQLLVLWMFLDLCSASCSFQELLT